MRILCNSERAVQDLFFLAGMPDKMKKALRLQAGRPSCIPVRTAGFGTRFSGSWLEVLREE
jgi:hypothetical protein